MLTLTCPVFICTFTQRKRGKTDFPTKTHQSNISHKKEEKHEQN